MRKGSALLLSFLAASIALGGCAYPRRSTALSPVAPAEAARVEAPGSLTRLRFIGAEVPPRQRGDLPWDDDGSPADVVVRLYRDGELIFESETYDDSLRPEMDALTENLLLPRSADLRIELWDSDPGMAEPIGIWRGRGLPRTALPGASSRVQLEGGASVAFRLEPAEVLRGTGIEEYELRSDALRVLEVIRLSPAGRARIREGDSVMAIDGKSIEELGADAAAGALSMAASRRSSLTVRHADGTEETVQLDGGYTWRSR